MELSEKSRLQKIIKREQAKKAKRHALLYREAYAYLKQFHSGKLWLSKIKSDSTKRRYAKSLLKYCAEVGYNPDELLKLKPTVTEIQLRIMEMIQNGKKPTEIQINEREAEDTLELYLEQAKMKESGKLFMKRAVISFYKKNRRPLAPDVAERYEQKPKEPESYHMPSIDDLEEMSKNATIRDDALEWFLESTAMRRGSIPKITWGMLREVRRLDNGEVEFVPIFKQNKKGKIDIVVPIYIGLSSQYLKGKYKNVQQHVFLHFYAYEKLMRYRQWLREKGIEVTEKTPLFLTFRKPYRNLSGESIRNTIVDLSIVTFGNGKIYTPHDLRRYCQTMLEKARLPHNWIQKILGKALKREQNPYSLPKIVELHEAYKSAVVFLVPRSEAIPESELRKQVSEQSDKLAKVEKDMKIMEKLLAFYKENKDFIEEMKKAGFTKKRGFAKLKKKS